ncbi:MAG: amino acid ABC transporter ATP-binding protein [bacterium]
MSEPILRLDGVSKRFGAHEVLSDVDLAVARGEVVAIIGPSGSGKSTLLRCINHLERPTRGHVWFDGEAIGEREVDGRWIPRPEREIDAQRRRIGMVFQRFHLFPHKTALANVVEAPVRVKGEPVAAATEAALTLLERVGLADKRDEYPPRLSGGQQQRVAIARALAMQPDLMLFDEATSALDPELVGEVLEVMRDLAHSSMTMLVVTHEMGFAREVAHRVVVLEAGRKVEEGSAEQVFTAPAQPVTQRFLRRVLERR